MPIQSNFDSIGTYRIFVSGRLLSIGIGMKKMVKRFNREAMLFH